VAQPRLVSDPEGIDRRRVLAAGGLIGLGAVLAACTGRGGAAAPATSSGTGGSPAPSPAPSPIPSPTPSPGAAAVALLDQAGTCTLTPATIAGPTWFDAAAVRSDVREGRPGTPLDLAFRVERTGSCTPLPGAVVDLWQCDASGIYSGFAGASAGQGGRPGGRDGYGDAEARATDADRWLRGTQATDSSGVVVFRSVYPGWYPTRTPHLHLKVHLDRATVLTTQLFFDDAVTDAVHAGEPYRQHAGRDTRNPQDAFYEASAQLRLAPDGAGWAGAIVLGVR
jgi:protocatechuate 3,4-dioxygenase beta subunit